VSRWWMAGGALLAAVSLLALFVAIRRVIQTNRESVVASLPLAAAAAAEAGGGAAIELEVQLDAAGPMVLRVEGPTGSTGFAGTGYQLRRRATGDEVALSAILFRTTASGFLRSRVSLYTFEAPATGDYLLRVTGVSPTARGDLHRIVLPRDTRARLLAWILMIVVSASGVVAGTIVPLVLFLVGRQR